MKDILKVEVRADQDVESTPYKNGKAEFYI